MLLLAVILATDGVLDQPALDAAGSTTETFAERTFVPALLSALVAGGIMTLFTWLTAAAESDVTRVSCSRCSSRSC